MHNFLICYKADSQTHIAALEVWANGKLYYEKSFQKVSLPRMHECECIGVEFD